MKSVAQLWADITRRANPEPGSDAEARVLEMKKAFYAGIYGLLSEQMNIPDDFDELAGARWLEDIHAECERFLSSVAVSPSEQVGH